MDTINNIEGKEILDSRGEKTIEVKLTLDSGVEVEASVPQGESKGGSEMEYIPTSDAISVLCGEVLSAIKGMSSFNQKEIDNKLIELDGTPTKKRLGANSLLAVSYVCARASACASNKPLWKYINEIIGVEPNYNPELLVNAINGGRHGNNNLDIQEHLFIIKGENISNSKEISKTLFESLLDDIKQKNDGNVYFGDEGGVALDFPDDISPLLLMKEVVKEKGFSDVVSFGIDAAANNISREDNELLDLYIDMKEKIGNISYVEDPFKENNYDSFKKLTNAIGGTTIICGDDLTTTNSSLIGKYGGGGVINGVIIKPNQIGTLSETFDAILAAKKNNLKSVVSHRSGETKDSFIADLAVASGAYGIKLGTYKQEERIAKYERLIEIEKES